MLRFFLLESIPPELQQCYAELFEHLEPGQLLAEPPRTWQLDRSLAHPRHFSPLTLREV